MEPRDVYAELSSIRDLMERSSKFISLSGLSGILAGVYALLGSFFAFRIIDSVTYTGDRHVEHPGILLPLVILGLIVMILAMVTSYWLSRRKAKSRNESVWNTVSRRLLAASGIPFFTGGIVVAIFILKGEYQYIAPTCLIFYGLALVAGSQYTFNEIKWLGICEILLGLLALFFTPYGIFLWALGFGIMHIIYGAIMHFKYER